MGGRPRAKEGRGSGVAGEVVAAGYDGGRQAAVLEPRNGRARACDREAVAELVCAPHWWWAREAELARSPGSHRRQERMEKTN